MQKSDINLPGIQKIIQVRCKWLLQASLSMAESLWHCWFHRLYSIALVEGTYVILEHSCKYTTKVWECSPNCPGRGFQTVSQLRTWRGTMIGVWGDGCCQRSTVTQITWENYSQLWVTVVNPHKPVSTNDHAYRTWSPSHPCPHQNLPDKTTDHPDQCQSMLGPRIGSMGDEARRGWRSIGSRLSGPLCHLVCSLQTMQSHIGIHCLYLKPRVASCICYPFGLILG